MSNLILHPDESNASEHQEVKSVSPAEQSLLKIVETVTGTLPPAPNAVTTWISFGLMTGYAAFPVCVAIALLADLVNAVGRAAAAAGLVDVQMYAQKRSSRAAAGLEAIYGVILDIDRAMPVLDDASLAAAPMPNLHWVTPRPGAKLLYASDQPLAPAVFTEAAMRLGLHFEDIDGKSWSVGQGQRLPTVLRTTAGGIVLVENDAHLANGAPLIQDPAQIPFPGRLVRAIGGAQITPEHRARIREFLEEIGIPAPEGPGSIVYDACPDSASHSSRCCYVNVADDDSISITCLAGHGGDGQRTWSERDLLAIACDEATVRGATFDVVRDLPVTWQAHALFKHKLCDWSEEEQRAAWPVWMAEKARGEAPSPDLAPNMLGIYHRRLRGEHGFGPVHLYFDALVGGLKYTDAAGRTYPMNCTPAGPSLKANAHECAATGAYTLVPSEEGGVEPGWSRLAPSLMNKAVIGQRHALHVLGVPLVEKHDLPVAFDEESWDVEPKTKVVVARIPFVFPEGVEPIPALDFFLRIYREGRLPLGSENDVRLFVASIATPLLRYVAPGLLGIWWFVGPPGSGKDLLAEIPPMIWSSVNPWMRSVKFDITVTDELEQKRMMASAGPAVYGRAKEAGKRAGFAELMIRLAGTESLPARQVFAAEETIRNTYTILADSAEDLPERREISRRTVMISVAEIADEVSKGAMLEEIRKAAPGLLLDLLRTIEAQPVTAYTQVANANTRPIIPVALARLFGATLPEVRGEDLNDIFEAIGEFIVSATGKQEGENERKKAMKRADKESKDAITFASYRLTLFIDVMSTQAGYKELFGKYRDKAAELRNRITREVGYAAVRTGKMPFLPISIGGTDYAFKFVRGNRNFILVPASEYAQRIAAVSGGSESSADAATIPASGPTSSQPADDANCNVYEDAEVLEEMG